MYPIETSSMTSRRAGVIAIIALLAACQIILPGCRPPLHKEAYLQRFDEFSSTVEAKCGQLAIQDFRRLDPTYQKFSRTWYEQFERSMTLAEKAQVWKYRARYLKCKGIHYMEDKAERLFQQVEDRMISPNS